MQNLEYVDQMELSLNVCKAILHRSLTGSIMQSYPVDQNGAADSSIYESERRISIVDHLHKEYIKIKWRLDESFVLKLSAALIMIGNSKVTMNSLLDSVLQSQYEEHSSASTSTSSSCARAKAKSYLVRIHGSLHGNDQDAILDAADQIYSLRAEHRCRDGSVAIEDLETHFRQCRLDGVPAILLVEDIHVFAARTRQTLLYTLLDLMHRKDCLFVLVGTTCRADFDNCLEKRVRSRLNAHLVVISSPSALQLSKFLRSALKLPIHHDRISQSFIDLHNCGVDQLFGTYTTPDDDVVGQHSNPVVTDKRSTFVPGRLFPLLTKHREWGRDIEFFCACALKTVMALSAEHPHLTEEMFERSVLSMDPASIRDNLIGLIPIELHLFASVVHNAGKQLCVGSERKSGVMTVDGVLETCDRLVSLLRRKSTPKAHIVQALCSLAQKDLVFLSNMIPGRTSYPADALSLGVGDNGADAVTGQTLVLLSAPYDQILHAFRVTDSSASSVQGRSGLASLSVSERIRRAVLEPLEPIYFEQQPTESIML